MQCSAVEGEGGLSSRPPSLPVLGVVVTIVTGPHLVDCSILWTDLVCCSGVLSYLTPTKLHNSLENKAKAISAELLELNLKVPLYNPAICMTNLVRLRKKSS